jgi:dGTPase
VAQIARDICRALGLNEDLAEAIALGHDLGHAPFGHEGEKILNELSLKHLGKPFKHNRQSLRIVDELEKLNLSFEVRDGIVRHDGEKKDPVLRPSRDFTLDDREFPVTLEGCVVRLADRIAYLSKDLEDALFMGIVKEEEVPGIVKEVLGNSAGEIIGTLVKDVIASSAGKNYITMSRKVREALDALFEFNYEHYYFGEFKASLVSKIEICLKTLYGYYTQKSKRTPQEAIDLIVGLTDQQAMALFEEIAVIRPRI